MKRRFTTQPVRTITQPGAPAAKSWVATICEEPANTIQERAKDCPGVRPAPAAAAPQTMPKSSTPGESGMQARAPARKACCLSAGFKELHDPARL
jgi:hypothetical protein